jgi:MotA/TolQ/ExbB proton channel family
VTGAFLQIGPLIGALATTIGIRRAFQVLETSGPGISDPHFASAPIGDVLITTVVGLLLGLLGIVFLGIALVRRRYRAEWFFWFLIIYGGLLLFGFPVGTAIGIFFLVYCLPRRHEFLRAD